MTPDDAFRRLRPIRVGDTVRLRYAETYRCPLDELALEGTWVVTWRSDVRTDEYRVVRLRSGPINVLEQEMELVFDDA